MKCYRFYSSPKSTSVGYNTNLISDKIILLPKEKLNSALYDAQFLNAYRVICLLAWEGVCHVITVTISIETFASRQANIAQQQKLRHENHPQVLVECNYWKSN